MPLPADELISLLIATSFAAGLNLYATVATLGLLGRAHAFPLPPSLHPLTSWYVIGVAIVLFALEFVADKIPAFDLVWNALHTFIRVPVAALIAYQATAALPPWERLLATIVGGAIALAAHGGKTAARAAVTPSPEPLSNMTLSVGEDVIAVSLTWLAGKHPFAAAALALVAVILIILLMRWVVRALRNLFRGAERESVQ
jgi:hypothetical protein